MKPRLPKIIAEKLSREERYVETVFFLVLGIIILLTFVAGHPIAEIFSAKSLEEVRIACEVSLIIFSVEHFVRKIHLEKIQLSVWEATLKSLLHEEIANEMITIIKEPIYREGLSYFITLSQIDDKPDLVLIKKELTYDIVNSTDTGQYHTVSNRSDKYLDVAIPEAAVTIDNELQSPTSTNAEASSTRFELPVFVPRRMSKTVKVTSSEVVPLSKRSNIYTFLWPSVRASIAISNQYPQKVKNPTAVLHHRQGVKLAKDHEAGYHFEGGLLPGQSFKIQWEL